MKFGLFPMLDRLKNFEHERERQHLGKSRDLVFKNTNKDIETILRLGTETGTQFEAHSMLALKGGDQLSFCGSVGVGPVFDAQAAKSSKISFVVGDEGHTQ